ncbi:hypothetical protein ABZ912_13135 [Nonomuraea angiospora]|uniref:hypothetical protein n=1 Tax=Nonomuraea angiospora TaxID=46172 RepID=UPI003408E3D1
MGCWTGYLLHDADGTCWYEVRKWGDWLITDSSALTEVVTSIRRDGIQIENVTPGDLDGACCRGVALNIPTRRYRCYPCRTSVPGNEVIDREVRTAPVWANWDAGLAWGGREELVEVVPEAERLVWPYDVVVPPPERVPIASRKGWFVTFDTDRFELEVLHDESSADWYLQGNHLISVVGTDLTVRDYRIDCTWERTDTLLPWLVHGQRLIDSLWAEDPFPVPLEENVLSGAVVDLARRELRYWTDMFVPSRLLTQLRAAWPGWQVERLPYGMAGHLAITGSQKPDMLEPGPSEADPEWATARDRLIVDPRPLRRPRIRVSQNRD